VLFISVLLYAHLNRSSMKNADYIRAQAASISTPFQVNPNRGAAEYAKAWSEIESRIRKFYFDKVARSGDLNKFLAATKPLALASTNDDQFKAVVLKMIADFGDSHFGFFTSSDQEFYLFDALTKGEKALEMPGIGAYFVQSEGYWSANMVLEGEAADKAGLRDGDVIISAKGNPFQPIASFADSIGKKVQLSVKRPLSNGTTIDLNLSVTPSDSQCLDQFLEATRNSEKVIKYDGKNFGYIHVWTLTRPDFISTSNAAVLGKLYNTDGIIYDLRGGYGGRPEGYSDVFYKPEENIQWRSPSFSYVEHFGYTKPLVVLTDHLSRSAKEMLSEIFKNSKRATLIGQTTAGNVLGTSPLMISNWAYLEIPIVDVYINGIHLEKTGVSPNIKTPTGYDSNGNDITLLRAEGELAKLTH